MKNIEKETIFRNTISTGRHSPLKTYINLTVGDVGLFDFLIYEFLLSVLGPMPGGAGILLRKIFYPRLFNQTGKGLIIGRNVVIRHPNKISIGENVTIDDNCLIDARGSGSEGFTLEDEVIINRNCMVQAKSGPVRFGSRSSLGSNSVVVSLSGVDIDEAVLMAGGIYISAGAYNFDDSRLPIMDQGAFSKGHIHIGPNSWIGTCAVILDGVKIGRGAVVGAGSVVTKNVPSRSIVVGAPAKVVKSLPD